MKYPIQKTNVKVKVVKSIVCVQKEEIWLLRPHHLHFRFLRNAERPQ